MNKPRVIGLSASLRNSRSKSGSRDLVAEFDEISTREELDAYLSEQAKIYLDQFCGHPYYKTKDKNNHYLAKKG